MFDDQTYDYDTIRWLSSISSTLFLLLSKRDNNAEEAIPFCKHLLLLHLQELGSQFALPFISIKFIKYYILLFINFIFLHKNKLIFL